MSGQAKSDENEQATDNAVSALGMLLQHHTDVVDKAQVAPLWVNALPLLADSIEAKVMHELLVQLLEARDPCILGGRNQNLPHLVGCLVQILGRGTILVTREVALRMVSLVHAFQGTVPEAVHAAYAKLTSKEQAKFQKFLAGQIPD